MSSPSEAVWNPAVNPPPDAACQGCEEPLWRCGEYWVDKHGITVCVKAPAELVGHGVLPDYVLHRPMPGGLRGSPA